MPKRYTDEDFKKQLKSEHPNLELLNEYNGNKNYVTVRCNIHNYVFKTKPNWLHKGCGCQKCYNERRGNSLRKSLDDVIKEAKAVHGNDYDYSLITDYKNNQTKLPIICYKNDKNGNEHGVFYQSALKHIILQEGCPKCASELNSIKKRLTRGEFIERSTVIHNGKYDYSNSEYVNYSTPLKIKCPMHGEFMQTPAMHLIGCGCPTCNSSHLENKIRGFLKSNKLLFIEQKKFDWLGKQRLDFYVPRYKCAIECQGGQHFKSIEHFGGENEFKRRLELDELKNKLCKDNNVKLIYIIDNNFKDCVLSNSSLSIYNKENSILDNNIAQLKSLF